MLIGYVSDERYVAIADAAVDFERDGVSVATTHTTARGAIYADLPPADYRVTIVRDGFGSKTVTMRPDPDTPYQFRLLTDRLLGYMWPKWVRTGELSEFRVHAVEPYRLSLWRYGLKKELIRLVGWFDEHGPRAVMQITPDGDYTQTGVRWNQEGYGGPTSPNSSPAPHAPASTTSTPRPNPAPSPSPGSSPPPPPAPRSPSSPPPTPGTPTTTSAGAATTSAPTTSPSAPSSTPAST
ncbi:MAG: carboxypeptidase-like regulatory domain-containing protein [Thermomicrobiales bacterium]